MVQWFLQRISGIFLFAGLIVHFYIMHYSGSDQVGYEAVIRRISSPYWITFDLLFLLSAIYHGFNGLWGVAVEYITSDGLLRSVQYLILTVSLVLFSAGIFILFSANS
jgi:succinate dehydrogenase / fumarate reductase membrane anchor subunit